MAGCFIDGPLRPDQYMKVNSVTPLTVNQIRCVHHSSSAMWLCLLMSSVDALTLACLSLYMPSTRSLASVHARPHRNPTLPTHGSVSMPARWTPELPTIPSLARCDYINLPSSSLLWHHLRSIIDTAFINIVPSIIHKAPTGILLHEENNKTDKPTTGYLPTNNLIRPHWSDGNPLMDL